MGATAYFTMPSACIESLHTSAVPGFRVDSRRIVASRQWWDAPAEQYLLVQKDIKFQTNTLLAPGCCIGPKLGGGIQV